MTISASLVAAEVMEWLHGDAVQVEEVSTLIETLAMRLNEAGIQIDRIATGISVLHPNVRTEGITWTAEKGIELRRYMETAESIKAYDNSPFKVVFSERRSVRIRLRAGGELPAYGIVPELLEAGLTDYIALPLPFSDGTVKGVTFATRRTGGFSGSEISLLETIARPLALLCELYTLKRMSHTLLDTYVGRRAGARVLAGTVQRGDGETISAVVGFFDLRGFTELSNAIPGDKLIKLLNAYFDVVNRAVEAHDGEVLKFIGDEVMAVFPYVCEASARHAARQALLAAREASASLAEMNRDCCAEKPPMRVGIALHAGDVFFGNVGAEARLDFTVVGPVVNLASRIAGLTRELEQDILVSEAIADIMGCHAGALGSYRVKGFEEPVSVFMPPAGSIGADGSWCNAAASALALEAN